MTDNHFEMICQKLSARDPSQIKELYVDYENNLIEGPKIVSIYGTLKKLISLQSLTIKLKYLQLNFSIINFTKLK